MFCQRSLCPGGPDGRGGQVRPVRKVDIEVDGFDKESLLLNFLSEFLFLMDTERLVFGRFDVVIDGLKLRCEAWGEEIDPERHGAKREIKAITYHMMNVDEAAPSVTVIFDI